MKKYDVISVVFCMLSIISFILSMIRDNFYIWLIIGGLCLCVGSLFLKKANNRRKEQASPYKADPESPDDGKTEK